MVQVKELDIQLTLTNIEAYVKRGKTHEARFWRLKAIQDWLEEQLEEEDGDELVGGDED